MKNSVSTPKEIRAHFDACSDMISIIVRETKTTWNTHIIVIKPNPTVKYELRVSPEAELPPSILSAVRQLRSIHGNDCLIAFFDNDEPRLHLQVWPNSININ